MNPISKFWLWLNKGLPRAKAKEDAKVWAEKYYGNKNDDEKENATLFIEIIVEMLNVSMDYCTPESRFLEDLQMDDLEPVEVIMAVEEEFKIREITNAEGEAMRVIDDMIQYLTHKAEPIASGQRR